MCDADVWVCVAAKSIPKSLLRSGSIGASRYYSSARPLAGDGVLTGVYCAARTLIAYTGLS